MQTSVEFMIKLHETLNISWFKKCQSAKAGGNQVHKKVFVTLLVSILSLVAQNSSADALSTYLGGAAGLPQLSSADRAALVSNLEEIKTQYLDLLESAQKALELELLNTSAITRSRIQNYYFGSGMIGLLVLNYGENKGAFNLQQERLNHIVSEVASNDLRYSRQTRLIESLTSIEARRGFAFHQLQDIIDGTAKVPMDLFPMNLSDCDSLRDTNGSRDPKFYMTERILPTNSREWGWPFNYKWSVAKLENIIDFSSIPLNQKTIGFFSEELEFSCVEPPVLSRRNLEKSVIYDSSNHSLIITSDGEDYPHYGRVIVILKNVLENQ